MLRKIKVIICICTLAVVTAPVTADAVRYRSGDPLKGKLVLSVFGGGGIPLGDFHNTTRGNHESGGADVALEVEWYATREFSIGLAFWGGLYDDRTFGSSLQTDILISGGFIKYTARTDTELYPYVKLGIGAAELEFEDILLGPPPVGVSLEVDTALALMGGAGAMWRLSDLVSVNGQVSYNYAFTEGKDVPALNNQVVSFDTQYIAIDVGISFYLF